MNERKKANGNLERRIVKFSNRLEKDSAYKTSPLQTIAFICTKLDQGVSEEKIKKELDLDEYDDNLFSFCVEFALENKLLINKRKESKQLQILEKNS